MCKPDTQKTASTNEPSPSSSSTSIQPSTEMPPATLKRRRKKRDKQQEPAKKRVSKALQKHQNDAPSGGIQALLPSAIGLLVLGCGLMAQMGFRGRASVAGIDLGTTNSVICVQAPAKGVGVIDCIVDPDTDSPIIPSVVSFLEPNERPVGPKSKTKSLLHPHPSAVVVGQKAKRRIDSHPHHTLYNAKRVLGRSFDDPAIRELQEEVEFSVQQSTAPLSESDDTDEESSVAFIVPDSSEPILPQQVGSYIVHHLMDITSQFLGHDNVKSAVICVPAKFNTLQRQKTFEAFQQAGVKIARVVEEPTAAALAYGLHRKEGVDYILVYDFGGGTLDISLLHVSEGFVDVMGSDGDDRLGGADFDAAVAHHLMDQPEGQTVVNAVSHTLQRLSQSLKLPKGLDLEQHLSHVCPVLEETPLCTSSSFHTIGEQLKIALSSSEDERVEATCLGWKDQEGKSSPNSLEEFCGALEPVSLSISKDEYQARAQPLLDRSALPVKRLLDELDLTEHDIDEVVMVGGTSRRFSMEKENWNDSGNRLFAHNFLSAYFFLHNVSGMPQIRALVKEVLPSATLNTHIDPDITVAYGAASVID